MFQDKIKDNSINESSGKNENNQEVNFDKEIIQTMKDDVRGKVKKENEYAESKGSSPFLKQVGQKSDSIDRISSDKMSENKDIYNIKHTTSAVSGRIVPPIPSPSIEQKKSPTEPKKGNDSIKKSARPIIMGLVVVLLLGILIGSFYYLFGRDNNDFYDDSGNFTSTIIEEETEKEGIKKEAEFGYDPRNPNIINVDVDSLEKSYLSNIFFNLRNDLLKEEKGKLYEFVFKDNQGTIVDFFKFASAFNIILDERIAENLGDDFSIFFFNDEWKRVGLAVSLKSDEGVSNLLLEAERKMISDLESLFLGEVVRKSEAGFSTSHYRDSRIRYLNLDDEQTLSIDYAIADSHLIFGTSKEIIRKIIDKLIFSDETARMLPEQNQDQNPEIVFADKLRSCVEYKITFEHILTGDMLEKEVLGIVDEKCGYVEQMPGGGKMECKYTENERKIIAQYYEDIVKASQFNVSVSLGDDGEQETVHQIDGVEAVNPLQEALNDGTCTILGY